MTFAKSLFQIGTTLKDIFEHMESKGFFAKSVVHLLSSKVILNVISRLFMKVKKIINVNFAAKLFLKIIKSKLMS